MILCVASWSTKVCYISWLPSCGPDTLQRYQILPGVYRLEYAIALLRPDEDAGETARKIVF